MQMKTKVVFCILLIFSSQLLSQDFFVGFNYSGLISGKNYESLSFYNLEAEYEFMKDILSASLCATVNDSRLNNKFISNPTPREPYETSYKLGVQTKYFPFLFKSGEFAVKPYLGIELGIYYSYFKTYLNMASSCAELYSFETQKSFYSDINLGGIFYPEQPLSVIIGFKYQISNPFIKYSVPICSNEEYGSFGEIWHSEKVNLNVLVWNFGFRVNF